VAIEMILDAVNQQGLTRNQLQLKLGLLLGYSVSECLRFSRSFIGLTCVCDSCGGEPQKLLTYQPAPVTATEVRQNHDAYIRRTMFVNN